MPEPYRTLDVERDGAVLRVWLRRPERLNAIDATLLAEIAELYRSLDADFGVRVAVLGGRGRSFCAGADRTPGALAPPRTGPGERSDRERRWIGQLGRRACRAIEECEVLTVARVHGHALGGGACFALACDFRVASRDAVLRYPEVEIGVPLSWAGVPRLLQEVGAARARELLILCRELDAGTGVAWGVYHRVAEADRLDAEVDRLVAELLEKPELAVHQTKTQLRGYARLLSLGDASEGDGDMIEVARSSPEMQRRFRFERRRE